jgi:hypothetical protein
MLTLKNLVVELRQSLFSEDFKEREAAKAAASGSPEEHHLARARYHYDKADRLSGSSGGVAGKGETPKQRKAMHHEKLGNFHWKAAKAARDGSSS